MWRSYRAPIVFHGLKRQRVRILVGSRIWNQGINLVGSNRSENLNYFRDCTSGIGPSKDHIYKSYLKEYKDLKSYGLKNTG